MTVAKATQAVRGNLFDRMQAGRDMMQLARETGLTREVLYRSLSETGNPSFATINKVLHTLGVKLVPQLIEA